MMWLRLKIGEMEVARMNQAPPKRLPWIEAVTVLVLLLGFGYALFPEKVQEISQSGLDETLAQHSTERTMMAAAVAHPKQRLEAYSDSNRVPETKGSFVGEEVAIAELPEIARPTDRDSDRIKPSPVTKQTATPQNTPQMSAPDPCSQRLPPAFSEPAGHLKGLKPPSTDHKVLVSALPRVLAPKPTTTRQHLQSADATIAKQPPPSPAEFPALHSRLHSGRAESLGNPYVNEPPLEKIQLSPLPEHKARDSEPLDAQVLVPTPAMPKPDQPELAFPILESNDFEAGEPDVESTKIPTLAPQNSPEPPSSAEVSPPLTDNLSLENLPKESRPRESDLNLFEAPSMAKQISRSETVAKVPFNEVISHNEVISQPFDVSDEPLTIGPMRQPFAMGRLPTIKLMMADQMMALLARPNLPRRSVMPVSLIRSVSAAEEETVFDDTPELEGLLEIPQRPAQKLERMTWQSLTNEEAASQQKVSPPFDTPYATVDTESFTFLPSLESHEQQCRFERQQSANRELRMASREEYVPIAAESQTTLEPILELPDWNLPNGETVEAAPQFENQTSDDSPEDLAFSSEPEVSLDDLPEFELPPAPTNAEQEPFGEAVMEDAESEKHFHWQQALGTACKRC